MDVNVVVKHARVKDHGLRFFVGVLLLGSGYVIARLDHRISVLEKKLEELSDKED